MKRKNKEKLKQQRIELKKKKDEQRRIENKQIINTISNKQIQKIKKFNIDTFQNKEIKKEQMLECLENLFEIILKSSYIDEIVRMTKQNISNTWFDKEINETFIMETLEKELQLAKSASIESVALKLCFWSNRIAHHLENEVIKKQPKHKMNEIYIKYYLNPK